MNIRKSIANYILYKLEMHFIIFITIIVLIIIAGIVIWLAEILFTELPYWYMHGTELELSFWMKALHGTVNILTIAITCTGIYYLNKYIKNKLTEWSELK